MIGDYFTQAVHMSILEGVMYDAFRTIFQVLLVQMSTKRLIVPLRLAIFKYNSVVAQPVYRCL